MNVHPAQHGLRTDELDYELPERLIATRPTEPRDAARLLVVHLQRDQVEHRSVRDLPDYLQRGDLLVFNRSAVAPARLIGARADSGGRMEGLFLEEVDSETWRVMLKSNSRLRPGIRMALHTHADVPSGEELELLARNDECWLVRLPCGSETSDLLDRLGRTPLPPYILRSRGAHEIADELDRRWYQTVYADEAERGSVAAPTAGLHFTSELLAAIDRAGAERRSIVLHVGAGTFKPVAAETLDQHEMHAERFVIPAEVMSRLRDRLDRRNGTLTDDDGDRGQAAQAIRSDGDVVSECPADSLGRLIAIGTTTVRALESLPLPLPETGHRPYRAETRLMIAPPYAFRLVDGMMTNFHLPRSTLLALVGAMVGMERLKSIYAEAVRHEYRFYSYGDAMLILP